MAKSLKKRGPIRGTYLERKGKEFHFTIVAFLGFLWNQGRKAKSSSSSNSWDASS